MTKSDLIEFYNSCNKVLIKDNSVKSQHDYAVKYHNYVVFRTLDTLKGMLEVIFINKSDDYVLNDLEFNNVMYMKTMYAKTGMGGDSNKINLYPFYMEFLREKRLKLILND